MNITCTMVEDRARCIEFSCKGHRFASLVVAPFQLENSALESHAELLVMMLVCAMRRRKS